jgi:hypothetical protein
MHHEWTSKRITDLLQVPNCVDLGSDASESTLPVSIHMSGARAGDFRYLAAINIYLRLRLMHHEWTSKRITDLQVPNCVDLGRSDASESTLF